jgi:hypothetical protein
VVRRWLRKFLACLSDAPRTSKHFTHPRKAHRTRNYSQCQFNLLICLHNLVNESTAHRTHFCCRIIMMTTNDNVIDPIWSLFHLT